MLGDKANKIRPKGKQNKCSVYREEKILFSCSSIETNARLRNYQRNSVGTQVVRSQNGSVLVTVAIAIPLLVALVLYVVHAARMFRERAALQELADISAVQAAAIQARGLNTIAITNGALAGIEVIAAAVFMGGHGTGAVLDATVLGLPEGVAVHKDTTEVYKKLQDVSNTIADIQDILVEVATYAPLLATQLPLLTETLDSPTYIIPYPLPGLRDGKYSLNPPLEKRGLGVENLGRELGAFVGDLAGKAVTSAGSAATNAMDRVLGKACNNAIATAFAKAENTAGGVIEEAGFWIGIGNGGGTKKKKSPMSMAAAKKVCKSVAELPGDDLGEWVKMAITKMVNSGFQKATATPGSGMPGFPHSLLLNKDYAKSYQIGVIVVKCRFDKDCSDMGEQASLSNKSYAVAQARPFSERQRVGGDLIVPDFAARLTPVDFLGGLGVGNTEEDQVVKTFGAAPWSVEH